MNLLRTIAIGIITRLSNRYVVVERWYREMLERSLECSVGPRGRGEELQIGYNLLGVEIVFLSPFEKWLLQDFLEEMQWEIDRRRWERRMAYISKKADRFLAVEVERMNPMLPIKEADDSDSEDWLGADGFVLVRR